MKLTRLFLFVLLSSVTWPSYSQKTEDSSLQASVNWQQFLNRSDMTWNNGLPDSWDTGAFLGNGNLGTIFWVNKNGAFNF